MKKLLTLFIALALVLTALTIPAMAADEPFEIKLSEQVGLVFNPDAAATSDSAPLVLDGKTVASDEAIPGCAFYNGTLDCAKQVDSFKVFADGQEISKGAKVTFNQLAKGTGDKYFPDEETHIHGTINLRISIPEGHYNEVLVKAVTSDSTEFTVIKYTNLTITAAEHIVDDGDEPVVTEPCWKLGVEELCAGTGANLVEAENNVQYATFTPTKNTAGVYKGDPYMNYVTSATKIGRYLLIKYNNHSTIPSMQIYMAQKTITSDANMIEVEIEAYDSGWTYVIIDTAMNQFFNKDTMSVGSLRFDPLESRNVNGGSYVWDGSESIDVAYIAGFTTRAGLMGYLEANEFRQVTKTARLPIEKVVAGVYTDSNGNEHNVTDNGDGTYTYTATDVKVPPDTTPTSLLDGSKLIGKTANCEGTYDTTTGIATYTATNEDPNMNWESEMDATTTLAIKYKTTVSDQMQIFVGATVTAPSEAESVRCDVISDGEWHVQVVDLSSLKADLTKVNFLRFDFFCGASAGTMDVEYIAFFQNADGANEYVHTYKTFKATFKANNKTVAVVNFEPGATAITEPEVPQIDGYTGVWGEYKIEDKNITIKAVYTQIPGEETTAEETTAEAPADETTAAPSDETSVAISADTTAAEAEATTAGAEGDATTVAAEVTTDADKKTTDSGCGSVVAGLAVIAILGLGYVFTKKKD